MMSLFEVLNTARLHRSLSHRLDIIGLRQRGIRQQLHSENGGTIFKIGEQVYARLGTMSVVGTVVSIDEDTGRVLVRFSAVQQDWYEPGDVRPFEP